MNSVRRGENICKELSLDTERIRLKLAAAFDELADITIAQVKQQAKEGRLLTIKTKDGIELRHSAGVDPRMIAEASRGLMRFAEFAGLTDRAPEVNHQAVTMVNLTAPTDGVAFSAKWAEPQPEITVDAREVAHASLTSTGNTGDQLIKEQLTGE